MNINVNEVCNSFLYYYLRKCNICKLINEDNYFYKGRIITRVTCNNEEPCYETGIIGLLYKLE